MAILETPIKNSIWEINRTKKKCFGLIGKSADMAIKIIR